MKLSAWLRKSRNLCSRFRMYVNSDGRTTVYLAHVVRDCTLLLSVAMLAIQALGLQDWIGSQAIGFPLTNMNLDILQWSDTMHIDNITSHYELSSHHPISDVIKYWCPQILASSACELNTSDYNDIKASLNWESLHVPFIITILLSDLEWFCWQLCYYLTLRGMNHTLPYLAWSRRN